MSNILMKKSLLVSATLLAVSIAAQAKTLEETTTHEIPVNGTTAVSVSTVNGSIKCEGWDQDMIQVSYLKRAKASSDEIAQEHMDKVEVRIEQEGDRLVVETKHPRSKGGFWNWLSGNNSNVNVSYEVMLPHDLAAKLESVNGGITVDNIAGEVHASSVNGGVKGSGLHGAAKMDTVNGGIHASFAETPTAESMKFGTVNGSIKISLPEDAGFEMKASTVNGSISTDFEMSEVITKKRRHVHAVINNGGPMLKFDTVNGSVSVKKN
jgi:DUF4097 and DUF4098 domain-containing protein YvlB